MIPSTKNGTPRYIVMNGNLVDTIGNYPVWKGFWGFHKVIRLNVTV